MITDTAQTSLKDKERIEALTFAPSFLKILKSIKLNSEKAYLRFTDTRLDIRSIDFKEGLGLIDLAIPITFRSKREEPFDVILEDLTKIIQILENFNKDIKIIFNVEDQYMTITEDDSTQNNNAYEIPYLFSKSQSSYLDMNLLDTNIENYYSKFSIVGAEFIKLIKSASTVDNTMCILFTKAKDTNKTTVNINSKRKDNLFRSPELLEKGLIKQVNSNIDKTYQEYTLYYPSTKYHNILRLEETEYYEVKFYENYLVIQFSETVLTKPNFHLYVPLKKISLL